MAVSLGSSARINYGDISAFGGIAALTIAVTVRLTAAPSDGSRLFAQWAGSQAFIMQVTSSDEVGFNVSNGVSQHYGKATTALNLANGGLYRIVAKLHPGGNAGAIWVNAASMNIGAFVGSDTTISVGNSSADVSVGNDGAVSGQTAEYSEVAAWAEYVPDWFCEAYGRGYSPDFYLNNRIFYSMLPNTSHLRDRQGGVNGTNTSGTDASSHPSMIYRR